MAARIAGGELPGMVTLIARGEDVYVDAIGVTDPSRSLVAIGLTQVSDVLFNGTMTEFAKLAINS